MAKFHGGLGLLTWILIVAGCSGGGSVTGVDGAADAAGNLDGGGQDGVGEARGEVAGDAATSDAFDDAADDGVPADVADVADVAGDGAATDGTVAEAGDGAASDGVAGDASADAASDGAADVPAEGGGDGAAVDAVVEAAGDAASDVPAETTSDGATDVPAEATGDSSADGVATDGVVTDGVPSAACVIGGPQCNNCIDDDHDGKTDYYDGECVSPLDNDESSFATGIPGDNMDACKQDCFFDGDSGAGNDKCAWDLRCDPASPGGASCPYDPDYKMCPGPQPQKCLDVCRPKTPNGCDCFGCCTVTYTGDGGVATRNVFLAATCTAADFGDPTKCPSCTQVSDCINTCEPCEVCVGKPAPDPSCVGDGGAPPGQCGDGAIVCGPGGIDPSLCPAGTVCITGCCVTWGS